MNPEKTIRLGAVGDIMLGDQPACIGHGVRSAAEKKGAAHLFEGMRSRLLECDLVFGNLESVLSDQGCDPGVLASVEFRGRPSYAPELARAGFKVLSVANNHAMEFGPAAFSESAEALKAAGIFPLGLREGKDGRSNRYRFSRNGLDLDFLAYSFRPDNYAKGVLPYATDPEAALEQIREVKAAGSLVAISLHWGDEYLNHPSLDQMRLAHAMVDAGASLILGHHPHVPQGVERYRDAVIAYSLGNFVADFWQDYARKSFLLRCILGPEGVVAAESVPVWIDRDFRPVPAEGRMADKIRGELESYSKKSEMLAARPAAAPASDSSAEDSSAYAREAESAYRKYRLESYRYFLTHLYRYPPAMTWQSLTRFARRRVAAE